MRRTTWSALAGIGLLGSLSFGSAVHAGVIAFGAHDVDLGDAPIALAVTPGDRLVVAVQDTNTPVMGWFDTLDWRGAAVQREVDDLSDIRCVVAAGDADAPILLFGGDAVGILNVDDSTSPPTFSAESALGLSGGTVTALAWDAGRGVAYGADDEADTLHWIPVTGAGGSIDSSTGWPLALFFTPTHLAMIDEDSLLVGGHDEGDPAAAVIDLDGGTPSVKPLTLDGVAGTFVAASADDGDGWLLTDGGTLVHLMFQETGDDDDSAGDDDDSAGDDDDSVGDDDDSAGDDDDSVGDDDDSAGDDDDSVGDDDDSAGDDDDSAGDDDDSAGDDDDDDSAGDDDDSAGDDDDSAGDDDDSAGDDDDSAGGSRSSVFEEWVFDSDAPTPAVDLVARDGVLYVLAGSTVTVLDTDGVDQDSLALTGNGSAMAVSSVEDGHLYVALGELGQIAVLGDGPFLEITEVVDSAIGSSENLEVTIVAGEVGDSGTCSLTGTVDGTIAGDGAEIGFTEEVSLGEATVLLIPGSDLEEGGHRLHLFCGDEDAVGRASLTYYLGDLDAPEGFALVAGEARVTASWTHGDDENIASYELLFSETEFVEGDEPTGANSDASQTSPLPVAVPIAAGDTVSEEVFLLVNGSTYYFAVAAVDIEGNRGPISEVIVATPNVTGGIAALSGDRGCSCEYPSDGTPKSPPVLLTFSLMLLVLVRRHRHGVR